MANRSQAAILRKELLSRKIVIPKLLNNRITIVHDFTDFILMFIGFYIA